MNTKVGVQTTTNHRKLMEIFLTTDGDSRDNALKGVEVSYIQTIGMVSPMHQIAQKAIFGFIIYILHLANDARR